MTNKIKNSLAVFDGNEAASYVAYRTNEICVIYPITPSSTMGELSDQWSSDGVENIWSFVPQVTTMQSEAGAAAAVHGALQTGALATTFTSSQGLLLMIPNLYRIAGELTPTVFHVATRAIAAQGMSIYGDQSDIAAVRSSGFAMLCSANVQEAHDMALISQAVSLKNRLPFLHFFDGFRTSHEISKIELLSKEQILAMIDDDLVIANRNRRLTPENPSMRGVVSDPDVYFQIRESINSFYDKLPDDIEESLQKFKNLTGREYGLVEYYGDPKAKRVIVTMGSSTETVEETIDYLIDKNEKVGLLKIRLFRPFPKKRFIEALPLECEAIAVLDRTKEPGAAGEPLYEEVATTLQEYQDKQPKRKLIGGRYGIASKEFTPGMVVAIFDELKKSDSQNSFAVGVHDDITGRSLDYDKNFDIEPDSVFRGIFYGLGADGTVGANKNSIKIIGESTDLYAQGYFVFDAKKTGSKTVSYLRFGPEKIRSRYLINRANFIGCHQFHFVEKLPVLEKAVVGATFLLNTSISVGKIWNSLPVSLQQTIIDKKIKFYVIDGYKIARELGMQGRINTIMQTAFFTLSGVMTTDKAVEKIKDSIRKTYASKGEKVLEKNYAAVDQAINNIKKVEIPERTSSKFDRPPVVCSKAPGHVQNVVAKMLAGEGDELPVSALPCDGTYPTDSARWEKRNTALEIPEWIPEECIQCGLCNLVCPHSAIRTKRYPKKTLENAPKGFASADLRGKNTEDESFTIQIYNQDCTGCGLCVQNCPINRNKTDKQALVMKPNPGKDKKELDNIEFFETIPVEPLDPRALSKGSVKDLQYVPPMFEFCGACAGCGETAYIKLLTQLFGDHLMIADACGCTLAYAGYLPTFPWSTDKDGRGPAFGASLFEDNAEFGYGFLLTAEKHRTQALELIKRLSGKIDKPKLIDQIVNSKQETNFEINEQRRSVAELKKVLEAIDDGDAKQLISLAGSLIKQSIWAIGGDGWAYDIGYGGVDHVLASGKNIKILVLDTEVYSNTGGQSSKATPRGAVAKFATSGKPVAKKDLGLMLMSYGNIYVASVAIGANPAHAIKAFQEADSYDGPAIILAYSQCIAHGFDMKYGMEQQKLAVKCGHWPLYRFDPERIKEGLSPLQLDGQKPSISFKEYAQNENRYQILMRSQPELAEKLIKQSQEDIDYRMRMYKALEKI